MRHIIFEEASRYEVALLVKAAAFTKQSLEANYMTPLQQRGVSRQSVIGFSLAYSETGKAPTAFIKTYLDQLLPALDSLGVQYLFVTDSNYFKVLTKKTKADPNLGYVLPCAMPGYEHLKVVLSLNYQQLIYNPDLQSKLDMSLDTLVAHMSGSYRALGSSIIHAAYYPETVEEISKSLDSLHKYPELTADIEAFSLRFNEAGIGTVAFAWDEHNGVAFACDYTDEPIKSANPCAEIQLYPGRFEANKAVRLLLLEFFTTYQGRITWHNAAYDVKVIIYTLWMEHLLDTEGMLEGLDVMTARMDDTKIITYLATNSTAGNVLGLKPLAHEFAGNWSKDDIKDIRRIPLNELLQYNLVDALSTWFVKKKYTPAMIQDNQEALYNELMLPSLKTIISMELTGMPMKAEQVAAVKAVLERERDTHLKVITQSPLIKMMNLLVQQSEMVKANAKLKVKQHPIEHFADVQFNPNSGPQLQRLLYEQMGLPVLDYTDTKQPATGADTIEKLINHTQEPAYKELLGALIEYGKVGKILSTFIPAFEAGIKKADGILYLHGSFNLGGTVSGRLSSSDPNLQNIPAGSTYGKLIKTCFAAPDGWLFAGADFNSLEDYISALTTKDPNKLNVYIKGFDGHCLRAAYYFRDQLPHIDLEEPKSVNTIKKAYPELRQDSKAPTFLLTYGGTYHGMMNNLGWPMEKSKAIEANYHELYKVSDEYVQARLAQASKDGYVEVAFGLRVRTPLLKQVIFGNKKMPYEAAAEGRTAGNALGQSYGLLNNRAANAFMKKVWASKYRHDVKMVALIHDAIYLLIRDDLEVVEWVNRELIDCMRWQELPEIQHDTVKLGAALDIFWPNWANPTTLPNDADRATILKVCREAKEEFMKKAA